MTTQEPTRTGVAAWSELMDPERCAPAHMRNEKTGQASSAAPERSKPGAVFKSAGVAVSLPRPALLDGPELFEGSAND